MITANEMTAGSVAVTDRLPLPARNGRRKISTDENIDELIAISGLQSATSTRSSMAALLNAPVIAPDVATSFV
jgi:hypothetical protein